MPATHSPRQGITALYTASHSPRQGRTSLTFHSPRQGKTALSSLVHSPRQGRTSLYTAAFTSVYVDPQLATWVGTGTELVCPVIEMTLSGVDIRPYLLEFTLTRPFNGKMTLDCKFARTYTNNLCDDSSDLSLPGYGMFAGLVRQFSADNSRYLQMTISVAGDKWTAPTFYPLQPSDNGEVIEWKFEDLTCLLENYSHDFEDVVYDAGDRKAALSEIREIARSVNISAVAQFFDFTISRQNRGRNQNPLGLMDEIAKVAQAGRRVVGDTIYYTPASISSVPKWTFSNRLNIADLRKYELPKCKNSWNFSRVEQIGGVLGRKVITTAGFNTMTFNPPSKYIQVEVNAIGATPITWQYFNSAGTLLNFTPETNWFQSSENIASARFIVTPDAPGTAIEVTLTARGAPRTSMGATTATRSNAALQSVYGENPERSEIQSSLVLDGGTLSRMADAWENECVRNVYGLDLNTPHANPHIEPGDTISVTDVLTRQANELWFVDLHVFRWTPYEWETTLKGSHGL